MIFVTIVGGLGNQMFQYAAARALALTLKQEVFLDVSEFETYETHNYALFHFDIVSSKKKEVSNSYLNRFIRYFETEQSYKERNFEFDPEFLKLSADNIFIKGYFQSEKYFSRFADTIRKDFSFKSSFNPETVRMLNQAAQCDSISIHFRRGDYVGNPMHGIDMDSYYQCAVAEIKKMVANPVFFIFSDDILWARENFNPGNECYFADFNDASTNFEDLKLMSACKHHIIANSSFSWWGAWLDPNPDKVVIAPKKWFNDPLINTDDLIPMSWIRL